MVKKNWKEDWQIEFGSTEKDEYIAIVKHKTNGKKFSSHSDDIHAAGIDAWDQAFQWEQRQSPASDDISSRVQAIDEFVSNELEPILRKLSIMINNIENIKFDIECVINKINK